MKPRHWVRLAEITGHVFPVEQEGFRLRQVVQAPLLQFKEDVEDVCISALKEKDIEAKLRQVVSLLPSEMNQSTQIADCFEMLVLATYFLRPRDVCGVLYYR